MADGKPQSTFERAGANALLAFARTLNGLPPYCSQSTSQTPREKRNEQTRAIGQWLKRPFADQNVLVSFSAWYLLFGLLFCGGFLFALSLNHNLNIDTTVIATVLTGPVAAAALAAAALTRPNKPEKT